MAITALVQLSFLSYLTILTAQPAFQYRYCFNDTGNYTATSVYHTNLKILLSNLTSNRKIDYGFYNFSYGQVPNRVSAIGLCRGDVKPDACRSCLVNSSKLLPKVCPYQKMALGAYDECMLRYSNLPILGVMDDVFSLHVWNLNNVTYQVEKHSQMLNDLLARLTSKAAAGDSRRKFAAGHVTVTYFQAIYGLVQCTPDLSEQDCSDCLVKGISVISSCCDERIGGRIIRNSCNIRFESGRFYDPAVDDSEQASPPLPLSPSSTNSTSSKGNSNTSRTVIVMVVPIVAFIILSFLDLHLSWSKKIKEN